MELLLIFEFECMPGSNSCSAAFFRSDSLGPPPFHASSTFCRGLELGTQSPRLIPVFSTSSGELPALLSRHVTYGRHAARAESNQQLMKRAVTACKTSASKLV